jgi:hypothetical protein
MYRIVHRARCEVDVPIGPRTLHAHLSSAKFVYTTYKAVKLNFWPRGGCFPFWLCLGCSICLSRSVFRLDTIRFRQAIGRGPIWFTIWFQLSFRLIDTICLVVLLIHNNAFSTGKVPKVVDPVNLPHQPRCSDLLGELCSGDFERYDVVYFR